MGKPLREIPGARSAVAGLSCGALWFILCIVIHIDEAVNGGTHTTGHDILMDLLGSFMLGCVLAVIFRCIHKVHIWLEKPIRFR